MGKSNSLLTDYQKLIEKADIALGKRKLPPKKKCKEEGCTELATHFGRCKPHYLNNRAEREAIKIGKRWRSTNDLWYTYNDEGKPQLLHRYVMEKKLGRKLQRNERVIWKDGNKDNNDENNLILESDLLVVVCPHCGGSLS